MIKRLFDIVASFIGLLIISPILLPVMLILKFTGEGEVFYLQERIGKGNKPFFITKFATMLKDSPNMGGYTVRGDPRVLPFGKFLRKSKINELPQLWDILRGKMSLVGPRPQMTKIHEEYPASFSVVLEALRPGVTGIGSIVFRDEEAILTNAKDKDYCYKQQIIPYKAELEIWYMGNQSFFLDIALIFMTLWAIVKADSQILYGLYPSLPLKSIDDFTGNKDASK